MISFTRAKQSRARIGRRGENAAAALLRDEGCEVLIRNCKTARAELDIVARDGETLVFVEVKTRFRKPGFEVLPALNLRFSQKKRIVRGARSYLRELDNPPVPIRFDLIEVVAGPWGIDSIRHHKSAFGTGSMIPEGSF